VAAAALAVTVAAAQTETFAAEPFLDVGEQAPITILINDSP
jgi:multiple sugar transport system substrate-binding protein